jgi:hypothetical protein
LGSLKPRPDRFEDRPPAFGTRQGQKKEDDVTTASTPSTSNNTEVN